MTFGDYDFGPLSGDQVATVEVRERVNVLLMDQANFLRYQRQEHFSYHGGQALSSPVRLRVPGPGHWHVVLDLGGASGVIHSNLTLPDLQTARSHHDPNEEHLMSTIAPIIHARRCARQLDALLDLTGVRIKLAGPEEGIGMTQAELDLAEQRVPAVPGTPSRLSRRRHRAVQARRRDLASAHPRHPGLPCGLRRNLRHYLHHYPYFGMRDEATSERSRTRTATRLTGTAMRSGSRPSRAGSPQTPAAANAPLASRRSAARRSAQAERDPAAPPVGATGAMFDRASGRADGRHRAFFQTGGDLCQVWARRNDGTLFYLPDGAVDDQVRNDVHAGRLTCPYPGCPDPHFVAKGGPIRRHHFAHKIGGAGHSAAAGWRHQGLLMLAEWSRRRYPQIQAEIDDDQGALRLRSPRSGNEVVLAVTYDPGWRAPGTAQVLVGHSRRLLLPRQHIDGQPEQWRCGRGRLVGELVYECGWALAVNPQERRVATLVDSAVARSRNDTRPLAAKCSASSTISRMPASTRRVCIPRRPTWSIRSLPAGRRPRRHENGRSRTRSRG